MAEKKRQALGRGLSALLGDAQEDYAQSSPVPAVSPPPRSLPADAKTGAETVAETGAETDAENINRGRAANMVPVERLTTGSVQPRTVFDESAIQALADSIKAHGVLAPLIVCTNRRNDIDADYEIVSGERRWRAAQLAQLHEVPVIVRDDLRYNVLYEVAMVDNLQRENLTDIEEAVAYGRMVSEFGYTQKAIGAAVGKSREHVANTLRLLKLPLEVLHMIEGGELSAGHGRALLVLPQDDYRRVEAIAHDIVKKKLSVRDAETMVKQSLDRPPSVIARLAAGGGAKPGGKDSKARASDANAAAIESRLQTSLGLDVSLKLGRGGRGAVTIAFDSIEQFDSLLETLSRGLARKRGG